MTPSASSIDFVRGTMVLPTVTGIALGGLSALVLALPLDWRRVAVTGSLRDERSRRQEGALERRGA